MASANSYALAWQYLDDSSIYLQSATFDSSGLCSSNPGSVACSLPAQLPGRAILPRETAQLLHVHAMQAQARLELYNHGPQLIYRLIAINPYVPYEPGYLDNVAREVMELKAKIWAEKTMGVTFNQRPIHPRESNSEGTKPQNQQ